MSCLTFDFSRDIHFLRKGTNESGLNHLFRAGDISCDGNKLLLLIICASCNARNIGRIWFDIHTMASYLFAIRHFDKENTKSRAKRYSRGSVCTKDKELLDCCHWLGVTLKIYILFDIRLFTGHLSIAEGCQRHHRVTCRAS